MLGTSILRHGLESIMERVADVDRIWKRCKSGTKFPSAIKIRLSDHHGFEGTLLIVDLLTPWSQATKQSGIGHSFIRLSKLLYQNTSFTVVIDMHTDELVTRVADPSFEGHVATDTSVLTKILGRYLAGACKTTAFFHLGVCLLTENKAHVLNNNNDKSRNILRIPLMRHCKHWYSVSIYKGYDA